MNVQIQSLLLHSFMKTCPSPTASLGIQSQESVPPIQQNSWSNKFQNFIQYLNSFGDPVKLVVIFYRVIF